jgi:FixJ family two-component response regulator
VNVSRELSLAVIDDDDSFRAALVESLHSLGYGVSGFASAEEFVATGDETRYDWIITDIQMPGMSGLDLKRKLTGPGLVPPFIMITARADPTLQAKAKASGAVCFLRKPFEIDALIGCLEGNAGNNP